MHYSNGKRFVFRVGINAHIEDAIFEVIRERQMWEDVAFITPSRTVRIECWCSVLFPNGMSSRERLDWLEFLGVHVSSLFDYKL